MPITGIPGNLPRGRNNEKQINTITGSGLIPLPGGADPGGYPDISNTLKRDPGGIAAEQIRSGSGQIGHPKKEIIFALHLVLDELKLNMKGG